MAPPPPGPGVLWGDRSPPPPPKGPGGVVFGAAPKPGGAGRGGGAIYQWGVELPAVAPRGAAAVGDAGEVPLPHCLRKRFDIVTLELQVARLGDMPLGTEGANHLRHFFGVAAAGPGAHPV